MRQPFSVTAAAISLVLVTCSCQTTPPRPDRAAETVSQASEPSDVEPEEPEQNVPESASKDVESESKSPDGASMPVPEDASVVIEVTPDVLRVGDDEILSLSDGYVGGSDLSSQQYFNIKGLVDPVEEALTVERRRRVVYGEEGSVGRVLVKVDPKVPADTILGLQYTLGATELTWLTLQVGDHEPIHMWLNAEFIGKRRVPWGERKPRPEPEPDSVPRSKKGGGDFIFGGNGVGQGDIDLDALSRSGLIGVGRSSGGIVLRGTGSGAGGIGTSGLSNGESTELRLREADYCDASAGEPVAPMALTYANVELSPKQVRTWLSASEGRHGSIMFQKRAVDADYQWWKIYNALADMRSHYGEADTLVIELHPALSSEVVPEIARVNCELPKDSYASSEAWEAARGEMSECEPLFRTQVFSNGERP